MCNIKKISEWKCAKVILQTPDHTHTHSHAHIHKLKTRYNTSFQASAMQINHKVSKELPTFLEKIRHCTVNWGRSAFWKAVKRTSRSAAWSWQWSKRRPIPTWTKQMEQSLLSKEDIWNSLASANAGLHRIRRSRAKSDRNVHSVGLAVDRYRVRCVCLHDVDAWSLEVVFLPPHIAKAGTLVGWLMSRLLHFSLYQRATDPNAVANAISFFKLRGKPRQPSERERWYCSRHQDGGERLWSQSEWPFAAASDGEAVTREAGVHTFL